MALKHVPKDYLSFLLSKALTKRKIAQSQHEKWGKKLASKDAGEFKEALDFIEEAFPDALAEAQEIWAFRGQRAIHLWLLNFLAEKTVSQALEKHSRHRPKPGAASKWGNVSSSGETAEVRRVRVDDDAIWVEVWIEKTIEYEFQDEPKSTKRTEKVLVCTSFTQKVPIAQAYASLQDARKALFATVDWLRGTKTPRVKSVEQDKILRSLIFEEKNVDALASRLAWGVPAQLVGPDATGEVGSVSFTGKKNGFREDPLDSKITKVQTQLAASNDSRRYNISYAHPNGYVETSQATFHFRSVQSRIQFHTRASQLAVTHVVNEVRAEVKK